MRFMNVLEIAPPALGGGGGGGGVKVCLLGNKSKMAFLVCLFKLSLAKATNMKREAVFVSVLQI